MIQKIRENVGTIVICAVIVVGVPAVVSNAATPSPEPSQTVTVDSPTPLSGTTGQSSDSSGAGGAWGNE